jgi:hypothetical protein
MLLHVLETALALDEKEKFHAVLLGEARDGTELSAKRNENLPNRFSLFLHCSDKDTLGNVVGRTDKSTYEIDQDSATGGRAKKPAN